MTPGHYIHKAHEFLTPMLSSPWGTHQFGRGAALVVHLLDRAIRAPVYLLPDGGNLIAPASPTDVAGQLFKTNPGVYRLPHPELVIECDYTDQKGVFIGDTSPKRRAAFYIEAEYPPPVRPVAGEFVRVIFGCIEFWEEQSPLNNEKIWLHDQFITKITEPLPDTARGVGFKLEPIDGIPSAGEAARDAQQKEYLSPAIAGLSLMVALACRNVSTLRLTGYEKLNAARLARGKRPFAAHHILHLGTMADNPTEASEIASGRQRASPMLHIRRGHIRRLHHGNDLIWINQALVGHPESGVLTKSYNFADKTSTN